MPDAPLADAAARDRIRRDLDDTLFVEAGAGSGKTTALVDRVVALVTTGTAELREVAAITFTEKAGAELRDRIRRKLQEVSTHETDADVVARCRLALDQLDGAAIGTLHSFAQRLLSENPIEAGLPPRVEVLDEVSSGVEFDRRWSAFREELLADPDLERTLLLLLATGVKPNALDALARSVRSELGPRRRARAGSGTGAAARVPASRPGARRDRRDLRRTSRLFPSRRQALCSSRRDRRACRVAPQHHRRVRRCSTHSARTRFGRRRASRSAGHGAKSHWPDIDNLRARVHEVGDRLDAVCNQVGQACAATARRRDPAVHAASGGGAACRRSARVPRPARARPSAPRAIPSTGPIVRARLHQRYQRLLLDEFQDTDPIQIELAVRIAAADPRDAELATTPWDEVAVAPGHLFVVGDPKQSIYRFRRADIATFLERSGPSRPEVGTLVELTSNFRSTAPVIEWVNQVFDRLIVGDARPRGAGAVATRVRRARRDPRARRRTGRRSRWSDATRTRTELRADDVREAEAGDVAATVAARHRPRAGRSTTAKAAGGRPVSATSRSSSRPARRCRSCRTRSTTREIPHRAESSSLVYATRAVRDLLMVLRAVDDPTNQLHIVAALRTPLLGCGDDDLFRFKVERAGSLELSSATSPTRCPPTTRCVPALAYLRGLLRRPACGSARRSCSTASPVTAARFELGFAEGRPRDVWRRLRFVIDQARAWSEATGGQPAAVPALGRAAERRGRRVAEAILPETDDDAVRIMTIHAAKGLEFPITIVSGMSTAPRGRYAPAEVVFPPAGATSGTASAATCRPRSGRSGSPSTSRWASTSASGSSTSRARGRATTWSCRCTGRSGSRRRSRTRARTRSC